MTHQRVTLRDLSNKTGFDKSTISRVLRNDTTLSIRQENIDLIKRVAEELQYVPDAAGRSLRSSRSFSIGAVLPSLQNPIHAQIVEGAARVCMERGYSLIIAHAADAEAQLEVIRQMVHRNRVDGLLALTFRNEYSQYPAIIDLNVPILAVNWRAEGFKNWITVDEQPGARLATRHLIDFGHRRIAHLSGDLKRFNANERLAGYRDALNTAGIAFDESLIEGAGYSFEEGYAGMNALLDRKQGQFTAVFAVSILSAAGALNALNKRRIRVPEEVSVIGFHDGLVAQVSSPALSTVAFPLTDLGGAAAEGMMALLDGSKEIFSQVMGLPVLVQRDSTAPPAAV
jgi:LacI family transcriptional regulator